MNKKFAEKLIQKNKNSYEKIASHFDSTRSWLWKDLHNFAKYVKDGDSVLDFGCGNGRLLGIFEGKSINYIGVDASENLIEIAKNKFQKSSSKNTKANFEIVEGLNLPFSDRSFDNVYCIAAFHHIPSVQKRKDLLLEFFRVLKSEGKIILTCWNLWQKKYLPLVFKYALKSIFSQFDFGDVLVPWKDQKGNVLAERYYHAFLRSELVRLVKSCGFELLEVGYFGGKNKKANLYIIAKK